MKVKKIIFNLILVLMFLILMSVGISAESDSENANSPQDRLITSELMDIHISKDEMFTKVDYLDSLERYNQPDKIRMGVLPHPEEVLSEPAKLIYNAFLKHEEEVDVSGLGVKDTDVIKYINEVAVYDPITYYSMIQPKVNYTYYNPNNLLTLEFIYQENLEEFQQQYSNLNIATEEALKVVDKSMNNQEKALAIHNYLAQTITYDSNSPHNQTPYGALVDKRCVCNGYATAYDMLLDYLDIKAIKVNSYQMNHAWNMVELNGNWYHVDTTWDDPITINGMELPGYVGYDYFLRTDKEMLSKELGHFDWNAQGLTATSEMYENIPRPNNPTYLYGKNSWYYGDNGGIMSTDFYGNNLVLSKTEDSNVHGTLAIGNLLYYGEKDNIYRWNPDTEYKESVYQLKGEEKGEGDYLSSIDRIFDPLNGKIAYTYWRFNSMGQGQMYQGKCDIPPITIPLESISLNVAKVDLITGNSIPIQIRYNPENTTVNRIATWKSDRSDVAQVVDDKVVAGIPGTAKMTAMVGGYTAECTIVVYLPEKAPGNIEPDNAINASDALLALRHSIKEITLINDQFIRGDVNKDGKINASDALMILRYSVKEISIFE
ncbi:MAG: transglutaminase domain-containing protein [Eubacterium sp.]